MPSVSPEISALLSGLKARTTTRPLCPVRVNSSSPWHCFQRYRHSHPRKSAPQARRSASQRERLHAWRRAARPPCLDQISRAIRNSPCTTGSREDHPLCRWASSTSLWTALASKPALKALARTPVLPGQKPVAASRGRDLTPRPCLGASVRNVAGPGEMSALGLPGVTGVLAFEVPAGSVLARSGVQKGDVILSVDGFKTSNVDTLLQQASALADFQSMGLVVSRQQKEIILNIKR